MSGIDVDRGALDGIASGLDGAASGLKDLSGSVPTGVDAGPMTAVISGMLSQVVSSAGSTSEALSGAAETVRECRDYYDRSDAEAEAGLTTIRDVMDQ